ncbi:branched-chain amino acid ABC transporter permease [Hypericibacter sp.]|uniref:branched-chain amino acid ABC transporter permease n=1 Tax=Hypericibacter sp. TaxID=2705401 RepID=UPI003D6D17C1
MKPLSNLLPIIFFAAMTALPFLGGDYDLGVGFQLMMWIALTQSWVLLSGFTGYISLGHAVFYGLGGYLTVLTWHIVPLPLAIPLSGLVAALFAGLIGYPVMRVRGPYFVILTFGLAELVKYIVINVEAALGKFGRLMMGAPGLSTLYWAMLALAVAATLLVVLVGRSRFGAGLRAIREDEPAAETVGVPTARYKLAAYALSAAIPGMVGGLAALRTSYFEPQQIFSPTISFTVVTMAMIGGSDRARGPIMGALFLVLLSELLWANLAELYMIILGLLLIGFVLFAPSGIDGLLRRRFGR